MADRIPLDEVGTALYTKAKTLIPGGTGLLSKRPELYLPDRWPAYYAKASGCSVTDMSGNEYVLLLVLGHMLVLLPPLPLILLVFRYTDMLCTPGCFVLGAADPDVNAAVHAAVDAGSFSSLNSPDEVELAELLRSLHPWAAEDGMVRYARGGGEICMMAVRIARAHTQRDRVAICGYHGTWDWYLACNLDGDEGAPPEGKDRLGKHWLADVAPTGVPSQLEGTTLDWDYGDVASLRAHFETYPGEVAAVIMEVARDVPPPEGFLQAVRDTADEFGAVLIFDEVSSAWREVCGGRHLQFGVAPDIATFSKTISNGFAMAALLGRPEVMTSTQNTFISTTYHTERLGPAAALATIKKFQRCDVQRVICARGAGLKQGWAAAASKAGLEIKVGGFDAWPSFGWAAEGLSGAEGLLLTTLFTQEMLARGYLANTVVAVNFSHTDEVLGRYLASVGEVFAQIASWLEAAGGEAAGCKQFLEGPVRHGGFKRV